MTKKEIVATLKQNISTIYKQLMDELSDISNDSGDNQKNSSGDKHETTKAMADMEAEKLSQSLQRLSIQLEALKDPGMFENFKKVGNKALFKANGNYYFVLFAYGKLTVGTETVFVLSPEAPLSLALNGLSTDETSQFNGINFKIESVA